MAVMRGAQRFNCIPDGSTTAPKLCSLLPQLDTVTFCEEYHLSDGIRDSLLKERCGTGGNGGDRDLGQFDLNSPRAIGAYASSAIGLLTIVAYIRTIVCRYSSFTKVTGN
ncbi:hypothetical protein C8F04DRAFT_1181608 [Mycena alexandri]|uniref:Uncharacterized protein n=1 Tax=Mycena alexandri TaxID=1745969 RepID=A0AAD6SYD0_9AGAR|nr:hypothetical protein C8F04DRAFT_1181608 [Mycena alexandri]